MNNVSTIALSLAIELVPIDTLRANPRNARRHSPRQIEHLKEIIKIAGFRHPILIDKDRRICAGHARTEAARQLNMPAVPAIRLPKLSEAKFRVLALADNRIAELAEWDDEMLKLELSELVLEDLDFDISEVTGFEPQAIDALIHGSAFDDPDPADAVLAPNIPAITQGGDLWQADGLSLFCGDALDPQSYEVLLAGERAAQVLTDPPFNVPIQGHVSGKGKARHGEFVQASGEMSEAAFTAFLERACTRLKENTRPGALLYLFMDGAHLLELLSAARAAGLSQKAFLTWAKTNAGMGSLYRSQTEHVAVFKVEGAPHANNVQLGKFGRNRTTLWTYPGANSFGRDRDKALALHPTVKPVAMLADAILDASGRGDIVLDPFAGSGSTLIAAHRTHRRGAGIELDPSYVDRAIARIEAVTGVRFVRARDGAPWRELSEARS